ncbi:MAG: putative capsular polysaccharide synthesis family protein [Cyanobacteria bacterium P01_H01_bin.26]
MPFKSLAQSLLRQNFHLTHAYHRLRIGWQGLNSDDKIVIYQMGKVGSTSVWRSLESLGLERPIYHIHSLTAANIQRNLNRAQTNFPTFRAIYSELIQAEYLRSQLDRGHGKSPWHVITLVRDPMAKTLSSFFQALEVELHGGADYRKGSPTGAQQQVVETVLTRFYETYVNNPNRQHPFDWFDRELKSNLGMDVLAEPALGEKSYHIYKNGRAKVLLLKLESLASSAQPAFQEFLGLEDFQLTSSNIRAQKQYGSLYQDFLDRIELPAVYLDWVYDFAPVKQFYSEAEIENFYQRWRKPKAA